MDQDLKVRENKARRAAQRRGWRLEKSRARDQHAIGYGRYLLLDASGKPVSSDFYLPEMPYGATIEDVERLLGLTRT
jgi:hypothetical protein